jgi:phosphoserine phosphatase RsbU/P
MNEKTLIGGESTLLQSVLDCFDGGACVVDEKGLVQCMNRVAEELTGYREAELVGRPLLPPVRAGVQKHAMRRWRIQAFQRKDGCVVDLLFWECRLQRYARGAALVQLRARETRGGADLSLDEVRDKLGAIFDTFPDGVVLINEAGRIQLFNAGAERLFGYARHEVLGHDVNCLMPSPYREEHGGYISAYLKTGVRKIIGVGREVAALRKDGSRFPVYLSIGELRLEGGRYFVGVTHDLTRQKTAARRLLTLSAAIDQSPTGVLIADKEGRIEYANEKFEELTGCSAEGVVGKIVSQLTSGKTSSDRYQRLCEAISTGAKRRGEVEDRRRDGAAYWAYESITPLRNAQGEITHFLAMQRDITEQKRDKEALIESEARFRHIAEMTGEWLWEQDAEGRYIYSSNAVRDLLGMEPEEIIGRNYRELLCVNEMRPEAARPFSRLVNQYRHKKGTVVFTESSGEPLFDDSGRLFGWRGVDHDITAHKAFEDALRLRDRAIESVRVGIAISDARAPGNPNIYVNPALCAMTGYSREELLGRSMRLLRGAETDEAALAQIHDAILAGRDCEVTLRNYRKGGTPFWNELLISPVAGEGGEITHFIGIHTDVTERRKEAESRHELEIAKHIQLSLLPGAPLRSERAELSGVCVPASHVGGDYFDFFKSGDAIDVVVADVSGHSVGAALIMTEVRSALRAEARSLAGASSGPGVILRDLNELLYEDLTRAELFITMFYMKFLPDRRLLKYASAGHNWPLLLRSNGEVSIPLDAEGLVIGVETTVEFEEKCIELHAGDRILLYTDGVSEALSPQGEFFGLERLKESFRANRSLSPENLVKALLAEVRAFCGAEPPGDDLAIVAMQVK